VHISNWPSTCTLPFQPCLSYHTHHTCLPMGGIERCNAAPPDIIYHSWKARSGGYRAIRWTGARDFFCTANLFPFHTTVSCLWSCSHAGYTCLVSPEVWGGAVQRTRIALCPMPIKVDLPVLISSTTYLFLLLLLFLFSGCHKFERLVRCMLDGSSLCIGFMWRIGAGRRRKMVHGFVRGSRLAAVRVQSVVVCVCVSV
jgi:hypothetical protein